MELLLLFAKFDSYSISLLVVLYLVYIYKNCCRKITTTSCTCTLPAHIPLYREFVAHRLRDSTIDIVLSGGVIVAATGLL